MDPVRLFRYYLNYIILILLMFIIDPSISIRIKLISNAVYIASNILQTFSNLNCEECTCVALSNSAVGWNCMTINDTCQLINNYSTTDHGLMILVNAKFFSLELSSQSSAITTTTTQTTTTPSCTVIPDSNLFKKNGATAWTLYSFTYTAMTTSPTLVFGFYNGPADTNYLDDVSVVHTSAPLDQLLQNPSFENSTSTPTGWITWCQSGCGTGNHGQISVSSCYSGNCYIDHCQQPNYDFLAQSFPATIGSNYTISFRLYQVGGGAGRFYANIYNSTMLSYL
ncbi:hypothetical protein I4U23_004338 [Adineta vaga]|nr:hypothetical protein I4U23_004338 [Adineta vaga]